MRLFRRLVCKRTLKVDLRKSGYGDVNCIIRLTVRSTDIMALHNCCLLCIEREGKQYEKGCVLILWDFCNRRMALVWITIIYDVTVENNLKRSFIKLSMEEFKDCHFQFFCSECSCINVLFARHWYDKTKYCGTSESMYIFGTSSACCRWGNKLWELHVTRGISKLRPSCTDFRHQQVHFFVPVTMT